MLTKAEIREFFDREPEEIEDIRRYFERSYGDNYYDPTNGDYISDDYFRVADLSTKPGKLDPKEVRSLNASIRHLNDVYPYIERRLGEADLLGEYRDVMAQADEANAMDPARAQQVVRVVLPPLEAGEAPAAQ